MVVLEADSKAEGALEEQVIRLTEQLEHERKERQEEQNNFRILSSKARADVLVAQKEAQMLSTRSLRSGEPPLAGACEPAAPAVGLLSMGGARHTESQHNKTEAPECKTRDDVSATGANDTGGGEEKTERPEGGQGKAAEGGSALSLKTAAKAALISAKAAHAFGWMQPARRGGHVNKGGGDQEHAPNDKEEEELEEIFKDGRQMELEAPGISRRHREEHHERVRKTAVIHLDTSRSIYCCGGMEIISGDMRGKLGNKKFICCGGAFNKKSSEEHETISFDPVTNICATYKKQQWASDRSVMR